MATRRKLMTTTQIAEANLQQLRNEVDLPRIKVSVAAEDLQRYIEANQDKDYLVRGFENSPKKNPFRKKKFNNCNLF